MTDEDPTPAPVAAPRRRSAVTVAGWILAVVFLASTVLLAVVAAGLKADKDDLVDARAEVAEVAGRFVEALTSYDYRAMDDYRERVLQHTAPPFSEQFEAAVTPLEEVFATTEQVSEGRIDDVFVHVDTDEPTVVVRYSRVIDGASGEQTESNIYLRLGLVEQDGGWKVNNVVNLNLALSRSAGVGLSTTSTTAPPG